MSAVVKSYTQDKHLYLQKWYNAYLIKDDSEPSSSDHNDQDEGELDTMTSGFSKIRPTIQELVIKGNIQKAKDAKKTYSRAEWKQYLEWLKQQREMVKYTNIMQTFKPLEN